MPSARARPMTRRRHRLAERQPRGDVARRGAAGEHGGLALLGGGPRDLLDRGREEQLEHLRR
jgi:hypothetical protein